MHGRERLPIESEPVGGSRRPEAHLRALEVERASDELSRTDLIEKLANAARRAQRLEHELDRSTARQSELARILGRHAVGHDLGFLDIRALAPRALDDIVLDTAAGHRADDLAVLAHREQRARRPRRAAPRPDDRHQ
jgi:hypothetical protein